MFFPDREKRNKQIVVSECLVPDFLAPHLTCDKAKVMIRQPHETRERKQRMREKAEYEREKERRFSQRGEKEREESAG